MPISTMLTHTNHHRLLLWLEKVYLFTCSTALQCQPLLTWERLLSRINRQSTWKSNSLAVIGGLHAFWHAKGPLSTLFEVAIHHYHLLLSYDLCEWKLLGACNGSHPVLCLDISEYSGIIMIYAWSVTFLFPSLKPCLLLHVT